MHPLPLQTPKKKTVTVKQKRQNLTDSLPAAVTVLGKTFKVTVTNLKGLYGDCDVGAGVIRIHQGLDVDVAKKTLFHEAIHAALGVSGHNEMLKEDQEEAIVRMFEHAFSNCMNLDKISLDKV